MKTIINAISEQKLLCVPTVMFWQLLAVLQCSPVLAVLFCVQSSTCPVLFLVDLAILFLLSRSSCPVLAILFYLSCCPFLAVLSFLSCPGCLTLLENLFWQPSPVCHVLALLSFLFCSGCLILAVLSWQLYPSSLSCNLILAILPWRS
jgi:hypothetical protein